MKSIKWKNNFIFFVLLFLSISVGCDTGRALLKIGGLQSPPTKTPVTRPTYKIVVFSTTVATETTTPSPQKDPQPITPTTQSDANAPPPDVGAPASVPADITPTSTPTATSTASDTPTPLPTDTPPPQDTDTPTPLPTDTPPPQDTDIPVPAANGHYNPAKGIVLAYPEFCEDLDILGVGWYFTNEPGSRCPLPDQRFVPRLYSSNQAYGEALNQAVNNAAASSGWLMTFVEPNLPWHGDLSPEDGAKAWRSIEERALPAGVKLVSPAPSQHPPGYFDPLGYTWIWHMANAYNNLYGQPPHFDAMAWNFYSPNSGQTKSFLEKRRQEALDFGYDVPFWVVEYAGECWNNGQGNEEIMSEITRWFQDTSWITHYAWFTHRIQPDSEWGKNHDSCSLLDPNSGAYTELGKAYAGF